MSRYEYEDDDPYIVIERHDGPSVAPFLVGLAVGAGLALLMAPRSGAATRRDIKRRARRAQRAAEHVVTDVKDGVMDTFEEARRRVEEQIDTAREAIDLKRRQVNRAMEAGRAAAQEARGELEQRIAETKAAYGAKATVRVRTPDGIAVDELDEG
ncbi:MAG TPA: YtxH domain-containing protein [Gemmatimonadaceae bacterium]|jgi:gas vesicle protein